MNCITIVVKDHIAWKKVEQGIEHYMCANKEITVKLAVIFTKISISNSDDSESDGLPRKKVSQLFCMLILGTKVFY